MAQYVEKNGDSIMDIRISKSDVLWNYIAQFFNLGSGLIVLPVVLSLLSPSEIGMNYLMLSVSSLVALADFGFSGQFGRNITYVFSGAKELKKEGIGIVKQDCIDYHLLAVVIETAKYIYRKISLLTFIAMISLGSLYMCKATDGFTTVRNSLLIWILFSLSSYFNMYFMYYGSLLTGAAMIMEAKKVIILNRIVYISIAFVLLFIGCGLISIVVANIISPFVGRWYSYKKFYRENVKSTLQKERVSAEEIREIFNVLWYNAKKLGINFLGAYGIQQSGMFIIGLFLSLEEVASYGLMCQLFQVSSALSMGIFTTLLPVFYKLRAEGNTDRLIADFSFSTIIYFIIFTLCGLGIISFGSQLLDLIGSSTFLPVFYVMAIYFVHMLLENFHSMCATMIVTNNEVPFVKAAIVSGVLIVICNLVTLRFTSLGLLGVVLGQLFVQSLYNHWKWPFWIFQELHLNPVKLMRIGEQGLCNYAKKLKLKN